jgi:hypothetical protein
MQPFAYLYIYHPMEEEKIKAGEAANALLRCWHNMGFKVTLKALMLKKHTYEATENGALRTKKNHLLSRDTRYTGAMLDLPILSTIPNQP